MRDVWFLYNTIHFQMFHYLQFTPATVSDRSLYFLLSVLNDHFFSLSSNPNVAINFVIC